MGKQYDALALTFGICLIGYIFHKHGHSDIGLVLVSWWALMITPYKKP